MSENQNENRISRSINCSINVNIPPVKVIDLVGNLQILIAINLHFFIKRKFNPKKKETKIDDFILESCQEMIDITQDPFLTHQQKLEKLKDNLPMFNAQSMSIITMNSTPEHLEEAVKRLKKRNGSKKNNFNEKIRGII